MIPFILPEYQPTFQEAMARISADSIPLYAFSDIQRHNYLHGYNYEIKTMFITATPRLAEDSVL